jgi:predicted N-acetyltransferase YhbS
LIDHSASFKTKQGLRRRRITKGRALVEIIPLGQLDPAQVEGILDAAFGPDRHGRTAYRLRRGMAAVPQLSFAVRVDGVPCGTVQCWPIMHLGDDGAATALVMVGPVAVLPECQQQGLGRRLMEAVMAAAPAHADGALMMIGDPEYYGRFFGYTAELTGEWRLPGPFEHRRLLAAAVGAHAVPSGAGEIGPRTTTALSLG